jgi:hypothetical protein
MYECVGSSGGGASTTGARSGEDSGSLDEGVIDALPDLRFAFTFMTFFACVPSWSARTLSAIGVDKREMNRLHAQQSA